MELGEHSLVRLWGCRGGYATHLTLARLGFVQEVNAPTELVDAIRTFVDGGPDRSSTIAVSGGTWFEAALEPTINARACLSDVRVSPRIGCGRSLRGIRAGNCRRRT